MENPYRDSGGSLPPSSTDQVAFVRSIQIITLALLQGVVIFGIIVLFINKAVVDGKPGILTWIAVGFSCLMIMNHIMIPQLISKAMLDRISTADLRGQSDLEGFERVFGIFRAQHIVACALLEGAAFFCFVTYMVEKNWMPLGAAVVLMIMIAIRFPTAAKVQFWVEDRIREIQLKG